MRGFSSSLASRALPAIRNISEEVHNQIKPIAEIPSKPISFNPLLRVRTITTNNNAVSFPGKSPFISQQSPRVKPIDHRYISQVLSSNNWFLLLNHELKAKRVDLGPQSIVAILQNQDKPLNSLRFYIWVSSINPSFAKNQSVRGVLGNVLYRKGPILLSAELIREIRSSGCGVTEDLVCVLVGSWGRLGLAKYCAEVFGQISYLGLEPTTRLYNAVIDALVKSNSLDSAYLNFQRMSTDNCRPDRFTYNSLIHGVCKIGVMEEAMRLVKQMEGWGYSPNVFTYTMLIDGYCNAKKIDDAFNIFKKMKERNMAPNDATYRSLVNGVFRCVSPSIAFELLTRFLERESVLPKVACDSVLYCLSSNSLARESAGFLKMAEGRGYIPDISTFNITMTCLIKGLDIEEACDVLDKFTKRGLKLCFNTHLELVKILFEIGRVEKGNWYLKHMLDDGTVANIFTYNMIIDCFSKAKMMDRAGETFKEMCRRRISPNLVTFNTLISGHCKAGEITKSRNLLEMLLKRGINPDIFTFSSIIDGLCRAHQIDDALDCFSEMVEWGVTPNAVTYNILIRSLCIVGDVAKSMKLLKKMRSEGISPDIFSFNALIQGFCRMNKIEKARRVLATMLTLDLSPDNYTYSAFIKALCESESFDEAKSLFFAMEANGCTPDAHTCTALIDSLLQSSRHQEAEDIVKICKEKGFHFKPVSML